MRSWMLAVAGAVLGWCFLYAAPPEASRADDRLEKLLRDWEAMSREIRDLRCEFKWTTHDRVRDRKEIVEGEVAGTKPSLLWLHWKGKDGEDEQGFLFTGQAIHDYRFDLNQKRVYEISAEQQLKLDGVSWLFRWWEGIQESLRWVFFGVPVGDLRTRFQVSLEKEDDNWAWLNLTSKSDHDRSMFRRIHVVMNKKTCLPLHTMIEQSNGNTVLWSLKRVQTNLKPPITLESLSKELPQGFKEKPE